ncbi:MAG: hypothetical protein WC656_11850 [Sulfurimonas sp.]|jgi:hypothetical protein
MKRMLKRFALKANRVSKVVVAGTAVAVGAVSSQAAVTYSEATGFGGSIDMTAYSSAVPLVVTVIAIVLATSLGIKALRGAK